jgi:leucyl aminopeptidase
MPDGFFIRYGDNLFHKRIFIAMRYARLMFIDTTRYSESSSMIPLQLITTGQWQNWYEAQPEATRAWLDAKAAQGKPGLVELLPDSSGRPRSAVAVVDDTPNCWSIGNLPNRLPHGHYQLERGSWSDKLLQDVVLGWHLGSYRYHYTPPSTEEKLPILHPPEGLDMHEPLALRDAIYQARDLINSPPNAMMPEHLAEAVRNVAKRHKASFKEIKGERRLKKSYPAVWTVGRASAHEPRVLRLDWGKKTNPHLALIGKGVCFDSGGLDIKPSSAMKLMKKDMGGAAIALAVARMIMANQLPIRLTLMIAAVENAVSGNAYRTSDVIHTRKGLTVEVGNTDAEGRLILCDLLAEADDEHPDYIVDIATLTGAARIAVGTDLPALFCNHDSMAESMIHHGQQTHDPMWRLPLWGDYRSKLKSQVADLSSTGDDRYAGAILAALFLEHFISPDQPWAHLDLMAWNLANRPGRPQGGEAMAARALYDWAKSAFQRQI